MTTLPPPAKKRGRPKKEGTIGNYFTQDVEDAITEYVECNDDTEKQRIYNNVIHAPLKHLIDSVYHNAGVSFKNMDELTAKTETLSHIVSKLNYWDPAYGKRAFSYFSIAAKNYYIFLSKTECKIKERNVDLADVPEGKLVHCDNHHAEHNYPSLIVALCSYWDANCTAVFANKTHIAICRATIELMRRDIDIDTLGRWAVYKYIRAMVGCKTSDIGKTMRAMRLMQKHIIHDFYNK